MQSNKNHIQQGDVVFERIAAIPEGAKLQPLVARGIVFAEGEATGHAHVAAPGGAVEIYLKDGIRYARVAERTEVVHEEHKPVVLEPGDYEFGQVFEYDYLNEMARTVVD